MTECEICCEYTNNSTRKQVICPYCEEMCCRTCFKRHLLSRVTPTCPSCNKTLSLEFVSSQTPKCFHNKQYRDHRVKKIADKLKEKFHSRFSFHTKRFSDLDKISSNKLDAVIFDLGISSMQLDDLSRGFSFKSNSELDMSMGLNNNTLKNIINKYDLTDLKNIFKFLGDEEDAGKIAKNIIIQRGHKSIVTTNELVEVIKKSKKKDYKKKIDVSTKTFQALRIFLNQEISELIDGIIKAAKILKPGGKLIVVSFHSLEDKIIKYFFKNFAKNYSRQNKYLPEKKELNLSLFEIYKNKTFKASKEEIKTNPRARSAKLRVAIRSDLKFQEPEDLKKKFKYFIDLEKKNAK